MTDFISPPGLAETSYWYAAKSGSTVWLAGQLGVDHSGVVVSGDAGEQAAQCLSNMAEVLAEAGGALTDLVHMRIFLTHWAYREAVRDAILQHFDKRPPSTMVVVASLARPECKVEIEGVAVVEGKA
ncbi:MAG: RidA family protein [Acidimicrobiales bacterium]